MTEGCLKMVVMSLEGTQTFSVHFHAFIESFSCYTPKQQRTSNVCHPPWSHLHDARCYYLVVIGVARYAADNPIWE